MIQHGESVENLTRLSFTLLFIPALVVAFGCLSYRYEIIDFLYNEHIKHSARVFGILIFSFLGICMTYVFGTLLTANGSLKQLNTMAAIAVFINLLLNFILIPRFGVFGAATASMVTQLFTSVYQVILVKQIFSFKVDYILLARLAVFIVLIAVISIFIRQLPVKWIYSFGLFMITGALLSLATGLLNLKSIFKVVVSIPTP
jgi:O-antigen/teichoic acid export membrane protein